MNPEYRILTNPKYPVFDPNRSWWNKLLGFLRLIPKARLAVMHSTQAVVWTHPQNAGFVQQLLEERGIRSTIAPMLTKVEGAKK